MTRRKQRQDAKKGIGPCETFNQQAYPFICMPLKGTARGSLPKTEVGEIKECLRIGEEQGGWREDAVVGSCSQADSEKKGVEREKGEGETREEGRESIDDGERVWRSSRPEGTEGTAREDGGK